MKLIFALLTTLFVSFMPLSTAYANDTCDADSRISAIVNDEAKAKVEGNGGIVIILKDEAMRTFAARFEVKAGSPIPGDYDTIVVVVPAAGFPLANLATFKDDCFLMLGRAPTSGLPYLLADGMPDASEDKDIDRSKI